MSNDVVITGIGMVTPLGEKPAEALRRIETGPSAAAPPADFDATPFSCPVCAQVKDFQPRRFLAEPKLLRLMNRDAQLAVAAAHLALQDAGLKAGAPCPAEDIALFGSTGLAGLPLSEVAPLIKASVGTGGLLEPERFGRMGLKSISPILSFKILSNMPLCFVSICENIQGPNGIYTPWEGQGAQAIDAGARAVRAGRARCALVGGCDVKTHELAFVTLEEQGLFRPWREKKTGLIPGEGSVFLVLELETAAVQRGAHIYARLTGYSAASHRQKIRKCDTYMQLFKGLPLSAVKTLVSAGADNGEVSKDEAEALSSIGLKTDRILRPKSKAGDLFAAAAALQVAIGALVAQENRAGVLANCFGHGSEQATFVLEKA